MRTLPREGVHDLRLRPRDGRPRCTIEMVAQKLWYFRVELLVLACSTITALLFILDVHL